MCTEDVNETCTSSGQGAIQSNPVGGKCHENKFTSVEPRGLLDGLSSKPRSVGSCTPCVDPSVCNLLFFPCCPPLIGQPHCLFAYHAEDSLSPHRAAEKWWVKAAPLWVIYIREGFSPSITSKTDPRLSSLLVCFSGGRHWHSLRQPLQSPVERGKITSTEAIHAVLCWTRWSSFSTRDLASLAQGNNT